ncbi:hypothetical protein D9M72_461440 [compost metagenome]
MHHGAAVRQFGDPFKVPVIHDPAIGSAGRRVLAEHGGDGVHKQRFQRVQNLGGGQHIIRCDARLPGIHEPAPGKASGGGREVGGPVHESRAPATQLQGHRRQVFGRSPHDNPGRVLAAGEEDVVEALCQQCLGFRDASWHHLGGTVQILRHPADQGGRCGRGVLARLDHHGVAGRQGPGHRRQRQLDRVVPGTDHQHHSERSQLGPGPGRLHGKRNVHPAAPKPAREMPFQMGRFRGHKTDFGHL